MKLIVGLGNPGKEYEKTRHNAGFMLLDHYVATNPHTVQTPWREHKLAHALISSVKIGNEETVFVKPQTFMNNSGHAVASLLGEYIADPYDLVVVYDDFDLDLGTIRVRNDGSAGGHNGVKSVIEVLKSDKFMRIRLGIGNQNDSYFVDKKIPRQDYVLMPFLKLEIPIVDNMLNKAISYLELLLSEGYEVFMSKHHE